MKATRENNIVWVQNSFSNAFNDGQYKALLTNGRKVGTGDSVLVKFSNGKFLGTVKQVAGFGMHEDRAVITVLFGNRKKGIKVLIDNVE